MVRVQPGECRKALETALFCFLNGDRAHMLHAFLHAFAPNWRTRPLGTTRGIGDARGSFGHRYAGKRADRGRDSLPNRVAAAARSTSSLRSRSAGATGRTAVGSYFRSARCAKPELAVIVHVIVDLRSRLLRLPHRPLGEVALDESARAGQPRDRPTHGRRRHLPQRPLTSSDSQRGSSSSRMTSAGWPPLPQSTHTRLSERGRRGRSAKRRNP